MITIPASDLVLELSSGVTMSFITIPAGQFRMGSREYYEFEEPIHTVHITSPFYLGTFPVTQAQFAVWRPEHQNLFPNNPSHPAEQMTWHEANDFCSWLAKSCDSSIPQGYRVDLPTEAQWEYACRAETETEYYSGDGDAALQSVGWYRGNANRSTQPVGLLQPNRFGLHDMHGNVGEWCRDAWDSHAYMKRIDGVTDPLVTGNDDARRVVRGGSWFISPRGHRSACRFGRDAPKGYRDQGFRVCLVARSALHSEQKTAGS